LKIGLPSVLLRGGGIKTFNSERIKGIHCIYIFSFIAMPRPDGRGSPVKICGHAAACFYLAGGSKPRKTPADADTNKQAKANSGKRRQETARVLQQSLSFHCRHAAG
jgi:hypothetical protein